jgi:small subunit ribosomal protein S4
LKESSKNLKAIQEALQVAPSLVPFVTFDKEKLEGVFVRKPERSELNQEIDESLIVEYYNRLV